MELHVNPAIVECDSILLVWTVFVAIYPIRNKRKRRLGDVVREPF